MDNTDQSMEGAILVFQPEEQENVKSLFRENTFLIAAWQLCFKNRLEITGSSISKGNKSLNSFNFLLSPNYISKGLKTPFIWM